MFLEVSFIADFFQLLCFIPLDQDFFSKNRQESYMSDAINTSFFHS